MKNARATRAKILFFIVKYANLWGGVCCRRRRGCLSSLISFTQLKKQDSQAQFDKSSRSENLINRLITKPAQMPCNTTAK